MHPRTYECRRATKPIEINGHLAKPEWLIAAWSEPFVDIEGDKKPNPRFLTRMKMLWDDQHLYIAAQMEEPHVWATLTKTNSVIFHDNDFEVFIDPDGDALNYVELEVNAFNTIWSLLLPKPYRDGGGPLENWHLKDVKTAVQIQGTINNPEDIDEGWSVEIAVPWSDLKDIALPPKPGDTWRINFSRVEWDTDIVNHSYTKVEGHPEHNWVWSPQGMIDMHQPEQWGYVKFVE